MRKAKLNMKENFKYETIKKLVETNGNKKKASIVLKLSLRQINRLIQGYKAYGKYFFVHGNRDRKPKHALTEEMKTKIEELYQTKYFDCTYTSFKEYLELRENINLSINEVRVILRDRYIFSPRTHKSTKKKFKEKLREEIELLSKQEQKALKSKIVLSEDAHPRQSRSKYFGEELQMDASNHIWFGNEKTYLHAVIDDATGQILGMYFDKQETLKGYYEITKQFLMNYGIPYKIKTDKRTVFEYKKKASSKVEEDTFTQYAYACHQLGIELETSSIPQFKPRIERLFQTLQQRLPQEFRLHEITTLDEANQYLEAYRKFYNDKFALQYNNSKNVFEKQLNDKEINLILAILSNRKVDCGHSIRYENNYYQFINVHNQPIYFNKGTSCVVIKTLDGNLYATVDESIFSLVKIPEIQAKSKSFDDYIEEPKIKKVYIPPMKHPWKSKAFNEFTSKQKHRLEIDVA